MIKPATYYEVHCDEDGCEERPDDDYTGWSTQEAAEESASIADWSSDGQGKHWCPKHYPECPPGECIRSYQHGECIRCKRWPEDEEWELSSG